MSLKKFYTVVHTSFACRLLGSEKTTFPAHMPEVYSNNRSMLMKFQTILGRKEGQVYIISFNRPHRLNAVTLELYGELEDAISIAEKDADIRVIQLTGEGRAFCVGADLKEHGAASRTPNQKRIYAQAEQRVCARIQTSSKPFVAAVNGYAFGAGAELALSCDFVVMREVAEIGFPELSLGTFLGGGLTYILPRIVGLQKARELIMLGDRIDGKEAERIGLIYKSTPEGEFPSVVKMLCERLTNVAPISFAHAKSQLREHAHLPPATSLDAEAAALLVCMETDDWTEGIRAFNEKRKPHFRGR